MAWGRWIEFQALPGDRIAFGKKEGIIKVKKGKGLNR
jgi:hypothetical protein